MIFSGHMERQNCWPALSSEDAQVASDGRSYHIATSLGYLVHALWQLDLSPRDVMVYAGPLPWRSIKWMTFQCPEPNCPYVTMIRDRTRILDDTEDHVQQGEPPKVFEPLAKWLTL